MAGESGAGTDVCVKCDGPKEVTRRGSMRCRACDGGKNKVRRFRLTLSVPEGTWDRLSEAGRERGLTQYATAQAVLNEWAQAQVSASPSTEVAEIPVEPRLPSLTDEQLARARRWITSSERTIPPNITGRKALRVWLESEGFRP